MLKWIEAKRRGAKIRKAGKVAERVIREYGSILERYAEYYTPSSYLPASKEMVKECLKFAIANADEGSCDPLISGYISLCDFRDDLATPVHKLSAEGILLTLAAAERDELAADMEAYRSTR